MSKLKNKKSGFTLIELMIVVAILGILAAIAIPAFATYVRRSKTSEVYGNIEGLFKATSAYYNKEFQGQGITGVQRGHCGIGASTSAIGDLGALTPPAAGSGDVKLLSPDPNTIPGSSYGETGIGFNAGSSYYVYGNSAFATACDGSSAVAAYTLTAYGNLDADADFSTFELATATNTSNEIYKAGAVFITSELE